MIHQNIRSLNQNLTSFTDFLSTIDLDFDVIGITETWLQNSIEYTPFIEGYNFIHKCRSSKAGGGVGIYIKSDVVFKQRPDLDFYDSDILESIFVEILRPNQSNIVIGTIYRQPNTNVDLFNTKLNELLAKLGREQKLCYLMGDFNIDFLNYQQHKHTNDFIDTMFSHYFMPLINRPTRITSHSATAIDNIFVNSTLETNQFLNGILLSDVSDHLPIFTLLSQQSIPDSRHVNLFRRDINPRTKSNFKAELIKCKWDEVYQSVNPNIAYNNFINKYNFIYNLCFPFKKISRKKPKLISKPWITRGLLKSIKTKSTLYKAFLSNPIEHNNTIYKKIQK